MRAPLQFRTIDEAAVAGANNFHLIRLAAALLVLFAHAFHLLERAGDEPIGSWFLTMDASLLGVTIFFFVSGFLVSRSWDVRRSLKSFLVARALRIAPALWLALIVTVFIVGILFTTLPINDYLVDARIWRYLALNAVLRTQYFLPGVFEANPLPGVNGSLWTIPLEVVMYVMLAAIGWTSLIDGPREAIERLRHQPWGFALAMIVAALLVVKVARTGPQYVGLALYFALGALAYRFRSRIPLSPWFGIALIIIAVAAARTPIGPLLLPVALPYAILTIALRPAFRVRQTWLHRNDYSYGTYLYGFPVQQAAIAFGARDPASLLAVCVPVTLLLAALSWHLVERRSLRLKVRIR